MKSIRELHADYGYVDAMLDVLDAALIRLEHRQYVDPQMLRGVLGFFREFVQNCHRLKVDTRVLPLVEQRGTTAEVATIRLLRSQYRSGGALLDAVPLPISRLPHSQADVDALIAMARRYIDHSRHHFATERSLLREFLGRVLNAAEDEALLAEFARLERSRIGPTAREWYTQMILDYRDIVATWSNPPRSPGADGAHRHGT